MRDKEKQNEEKKKKHIKATENGRIQSQELRHSIFPARLTLLSEG